MTRIDIIKRTITIITLTILALTIIFPVGVSAKEKTNMGLVKEYCTKHYKGYKVVVVPQGDKRIEKRKGQKKVYVEKIFSKSQGKYGYTLKGHYYIAYNKKVKKGKKVTSYLIYNPKTNYIDDVVAVVDNKMIR